LPGRSEALRHILEHRVAVALSEYTRERAPLDWAMTQNNLGSALRALGERESGTARLEEAVTAWEACLTAAGDYLAAGAGSSIRTRRNETRAEIERRLAA
jgi:hypothetical protein